MTLTDPQARKNASFAFGLLAFAAGMVMLAYASVPLYRLFCQVTGFGGTTQVAKAAPDRVVERYVTVDFNTDTRDGLPWAFTADQRQVSVRIGEATLVAFTARNTSDAPVTGMAVYNVTPHEAGKYFMKTQCFCFEKQTIAPGQGVHFPVSFYLDPALADDPHLRRLTNITLSYTFFPLKPS
jgi:cytochrome c oxidase assembly protein subunit 11